MLDILSKAEEESVNCTNLLDQLQSSIRNNFVEQLNSSKMMPFYKISYDDNLDKLYLQCKRWSLVRLAFQLKCNLGKYNVGKETLKLLCYNWQLKMEM